MTKYNIGDKVICIKYSIGTKLVADSNGIREENFVDTIFFNRVGKISNTYKKCMDDYFSTEHDDKEEYEVEFEDGTTIAWVTDKELIPILTKHSMVNEVLQSKNEG